MEVVCTHTLPGHDTTAYMRGYIEKRRHDTAHDAIQLPAGGLRYTVPVDVPAWVTKMLGLPVLTFVEDVAWENGTVQIRASCTAADVRVHTVLTSDATGGTHVRTRVNVVPAYKGVPVPEMLVRTVVRHLFHKERGRDLAYIQKNIQKNTNHAK